jgi:hypothetical protein
LIIGGSNLVNNVHHLFLKVFKQKVFNDVCNVNREASANDRQQFPG